MSTKISTGLGILIACCSLVAACARKPDDKFDRVEWRVAAANCAAGARAKMLDDVRNNQHLLGMSHNDIENTLGHDERPKTKKELRYCVDLAKDAPGPDAGSGPRFRWLVVSFDADHVRSVDVVSD